MQEDTDPTLTSSSMDISRRQVIIGGASAVLLAACGSSGHVKAKGTASTESSGARQLFNAFDAEQPVGKALRLPNCRLQVVKASAPGERRLQVLQPEPQGGERAAQLVGGMGGKL